MSILVVYWSNTGNTKTMAEAIFEGVKSINQGAELKSVFEIDPREVKKYNKVLFGSPAMGYEEWDRDFYIPWYDIAEQSITYQLIGLFGTFGWGDGLWMKKWEERVRDKKLNLFENGLKINAIDIDDCYQKCFDFGMNFAKR